MSKAIEDNEVAKVMAYMYDNVCGYRSSKPRGAIALVLGIEDRHFRAICATIDEVITSCHRGYYILPLVDPTGEETRVARDIVENEDRRRVIALYLRTRRQKVAIKKMQSAERQQEFVGIAT